MQTGAELAPINQAKADIRALLAKAIEHHEAAQAAKTEVEDKQKFALREAWQAGIALNQLKALFPHGSWIPWLLVNFCKARDVSYRTAALYMKIASENSNVQRVADLKFDTVRKYALSFAPEKEKPQLSGNVKLPKLLHHLTVVNEFNRWKRRRDTGQIEKDEEEERRDYRELYDWLRELYGDAH
ncbi:MAG TPA: hypothetical protein VHW03_09990 [Chthoniobacterales bacterium]|nr:hypothetical protein [Chthoniobacterales bacterium]